ncbi:MAG: hypothetical protein RDV48_25690 [Candidatus Eremiobacteraeota bacterium]|nr:hypothetical protein [Candidatus Eremiobacteraeota bacterium]
MESEISGFRQGSMLHEKNPLPPRRSQDGLKEEGAHTAGTGSSDDSAHISREGLKGLESSPLRYAPLSPEHPSPGPRQAGSAETPVTSDRAQAAGSAAPDAQIRQSMQLMSHMLGAMGNMLSMMQSMMSMRGGKIDYRRNTDGITADSRITDTLKKELGGYRYGGGLDFTSYGRQRDVTGSDWGSVLTDILQHIHKSDPDMDPYDIKNTWAHEATHGINACLTVYEDKSGQGRSGFYVGNDKAVFLDDPGLKKPVGQYVPESLKGYRYDLYIKDLGKNPRFDEQQVFKIFDEWVAYTNGSAVSLELTKKGIYKDPPEDAAAAPLEFTAYSFAAAMAVEKENPEFFRNNRQFKEFVAWQGIRAMDLFRESKAQKNLAWPGQEKSLQDFQSSPDAEPLRQFISRNFGEDYLKRLLYGGK